MVWVRGVGAWKVRCRDWRADQRTRLDCGGWYLVRIVRRGVGRGEGGDERVRWL